MKTWTSLKEDQPVVMKMIERMIKDDRMAHAYLLHGDPGTGKQAIALHLAMRIFCKSPHGAEPCKTCTDCRRVESGNHPDLHWLKPEGASIKKEQIQDLQREFTYQGLESNKKVYVIENSDKMTTNAANRLLKFLEEPSRETTAILLTDNQYRLLDTIRSRCQLLALRPLSPKALEAALINEGISPHNARLFQAIAPQLEQAKALDQDTWFADARKLMVQLVSMLHSRSNESLFFVEKQWMEHFKDREQLKIGLNLLLHWFKDLIYIQIEDNASLVMLDYKEQLEQQAFRYTKQQLTTILETITHAVRKLDQNVHPTLVMEQLTLQMQR
ncbi:DNA polymerase III delta prime subunit [Streptohalobacillus salinus]|uniref:DNA polymerase III delta prime subunit n=1 Tax=Streptohalobacillus salinus TaxID=621096 RepID=A0A2V3W452_9BACI|nr:DNA polymerase III subunit delta' [Streptohalobacillus salinus]PXW88486.1 DNA polymerase III delta prime subunit [Streptohalobacillus salinus]